MAQFSDDELQAVVSRYEATRAAALTERDEQLRAFHAAGWRPVDLQRVTGYSRETIRQALRPEVRRATNINRRRTSPQPPAGRLQGKFQHPASQAAARGGGRRC